MKKDLRVRMAPGLSAPLTPHLFARLKDFSRSSGIPMAKILRFLVECLVGDRDFNQLKALLSPERPTTLSEETVRAIASQLANMPKEGGGENDWTRI